MRQGDCYSVSDQNKPEQNIDGLRFSILAKITSKIELKPKKNQDTGKRLASLMQTITKVNYLIDHMAQCFKFILFFLSSSINVLHFRHVLPSSRF